MYLNILFKIVVVLLFGALFGTSRAQTITGKVVDTKNYPLRGTKIKVGTSVAVADSLGQFALNTPILWHLNPTNPELIRIDGNTISCSKTKPFQRFSIHLYTVHGRDIFTASCMTDATGNASINGKSGLSAHTSGCMLFMKINLGKKSIALPFNTLFNVPFSYALNSSAITPSFAKVATQQQQAEISKSGYSTQMVNVPAGGNMGIITLNTKYLTDTIEAPFDLALLFYPAGWIGDYADITASATNNTNLRTGDPDQKNMKCTYTPAGTNGWAGIMWQYPNNNWGEYQGHIVTGAKKIVFWAMGETGNEIVEIKSGNDQGTGAYRDSYVASLGQLKLPAAWTKYEVDLAGKDLSMVLFGFTWVATKATVPGTSITFYLDEMRFE